MSEECWSDPLSHNGVREAWRVYSHGQLVLLDGVMDEIASSPKFIF